MSPPAERRPGGGGAAHEKVSPTQEQTTSGVSRCEVCNAAAIGEAKPVHLPWCRYVEPVLPVRTEVV